MASTKEQSFKLFQKRAVSKKFGSKGEGVEEDGDNQTARVFFIKYWYSDPPREDDM
jgi:hypothetical protein